MTTRMALAALFLFTGCTSRTIGEPKDTPDLAVGTEGLPTVPQADLAVATGCVQLTTWSATNPIGAGNNTDVDMGIAWFDSVEQGHSPGLFGGSSDVLSYNYFDRVGSSPSVTFPHALDFSNTTENLVIQLALPDPPSFLVATSGDVTVTAADDTQPIGKIAAHGTNVHFQEVDADLVVVPSGRCVELGSFDLSASYYNQN